MPFEYWVLLGVAILTSLVCTPLLRMLAVRLEITDQPSARKVHRVPIPYLGGLSFFASMTAVVIVAELWFPYMMPPLRLEWMVLYSMSLLILLLGIVDDVVQLSARFKLLIQILIAIGLVVFGFTITRVTSPLGGSIPLGWLGHLLSVLWILTIVNAINFIDGLDGLAAGVVFFAALANLIIALDPLQPIICIISIVIMGGTLGFLPYNFSPASIFMGDAGALYLGLLLAGTALSSNVKGATVLSLLLPLVILGLPLLDTTLTVFRRGRRGGQLFKADREHLHHRLLRIGLTDRQAVLFVYGMCFLLSMSAVLASKLPPQYAFFFIGVYLAGMVWAVFVFRAFEQRIISPRE